MSLYKYINIKYNETNKFLLIYKDIPLSELNKIIRYGFNIDNNYNIIGIKNNTNNNLIMLSDLSKKIDIIDNSEYELILDDCIIFYLFK